MPTHTSFTHHKNMDLYKDRAKNIDLIWCDQVINLLQEITNKNENYSINDIGCNYGQVYKKIKRKKLEKKYSYSGYDIDDNFLSIAREYLPELKNKIQVLDIEKETPSSAQITICSATFEHLDSPKHALKNLFMCTKDLLILRTFVGSKNISFEQNDKKYADNPYNINQFNLYDIASKFLDNGFNFELITDIATNNSKKYEVGQGSGVIRQMFILIGKKK